MSNVVPLIASQRTCIFCGNIFSMIGSPVNKKFCNLDCSNGYHNELKRQKMLRLKTTHPEVYREVFECRAIEG